MKNTNSTRPRFTLPGTGTAALTGESSERSMFETVTTGISRISRHSAQDEPTTATIAKRFSAMGKSGRNVLNCAEYRF